MKFCKLFRFFNHTLQNQKRRNSYVDVTSSHRGVFCEKDVLKNLPDFTGKHLCWNLFLVKLNPFSGLLIYQNKKRLQHRFFCEIFKNTYFEEHLRTTASKLLFREKPHWLNNMRLLILNIFTAKIIIFSNNLYRRISIRRTHHNADDISIRRTANLGTERFPGQTLIRKSL